MGIFQKGGNGNCYRDIDKTDWFLIFFLFQYNHPKNLRQQ